MIQNQLAAKEIIAKYYIKIQKWIPAINRLKIVINEYDETIFIEEALHRLVEIYYNIGLIREAEKTAKILGYNYNLVNGMKIPMHFLIRIIKKNNFR